MEEGSELIERVTKGGVLPQITSCSPGWIKFIEYYYPELLPHLSAANRAADVPAPRKDLLRAEGGHRPKDIVSVSIMCVSRRSSRCDRPEMYSSGFKDVDYVLTTREAAGMMHEAGIDLPNLEDSEFDAPFGITTGRRSSSATPAEFMEARFARPTR